MSFETKNLSLAIIAGFVITVAAMIAITPAHAHGMPAQQKWGYPVHAQAKVARLGNWDHLNVRKGPHFKTQKIGELRTADRVWVTNCVKVPGTSDWCRIDNGRNAGWVNAHYLKFWHN